MVQKLDLVINQGTTFSVNYTYLNSANVAVDLASYGVFSEMRKSYFSANAYSFVANGNSNGIITLSMTANVTANLDSGRYVYDVDIVNSSNVSTRILEGIVTVKPSATKL